MTGGGINKIYTHLCGSITHGGILSITYEAILNFIYKPILSNSYEVE